MDLQDPSMEIDDDETLGEFEKGEHMDLVAAGYLLSESQTNEGGSNVAGPSSQPSQNEDTNDDPLKKAYGKKGRKKTSIIHKEMTIVTFPDGTSKRRCNWCGAKFSVDNVSQSTSSAKKHLVACNQRKARLSQNGRQVQTIIRANANTSLTDTWTYNHAKVRELAAHLILGHEYPFTLFEGVIFNTFLKELCPWYKRITRHTVKKDCESFVEGERLKMKVVLSKVDRVSLTTDLWWSGEQKIGYMTVTGHYIDSNWQLHKRVLSFTNVPPPHSGEVLARELIKVIDFWRIKDKVVSITVDNASANDNCIGRLKKDLTSKKSLVLNGQLFHVRCCAHILNLLVQDGLEVIRDVVDKIRAGVKYLVSSEKRCKEFLKIIKVFELEGRMQVLDTKTRWNSTWFMLSSACFYKSVWPRYAEENAGFLHYLPTESEWDKVEDICSFLEVFADVTEVISGTYYPTVNLFLAELWRVKALLDESVEIQNKPHLELMAAEMKLKYDKYWAQCDILFAIGAFLDPRYKMVFISWVYPSIYGDKAKINEAHLSSSLHRLFMEYENIYKVKDVQQSSNKSIVNHNVTRFGKGKRSFETYLNTVEKVDSTKTDLDLYIEESVLKVPAGTKFDVLQWWRANEAKYPILSKLAKDILSIPVSTVASESTFSAGKRIIDPKRTSMKVETVEMLLCGSDWVKEMYGIKKMKDHLVEEVVQEQLECDFSKLSLDESEPSAASKAT